ncbi:glucosaminidase domain-containing protein [Sneathiella sp.]|jgi:Bax protein|uniref:glucosaminidase domain-containing protein n=1 Tax=Sneathiella sp. TaxID=1964365 RepID=UPI0039E62282
MHQITTLFKSARLATVLVLGVAGLYVATDFGTYPSQQSAAAKMPKPYAVVSSDAVDPDKLAMLSVPVPLTRPADLPYVEQPHQVNVVSLDQKWSGMSFDLDAIRFGREVPRYFVEQMPVDILDITQVDERKRVFLSLALPLILKVNEEIQAERQRLERIITARSHRQDISSKDKRWLRRLAKKYKGSTKNLADLSARVDTIPVSLALAQSIEESGWGTSRFAREGNALFGQRVWSTGDGLIPVEREEGANYEVKAYDALVSSIRDYARNLNSFSAYEEFRQQRSFLKSLYGKANGYDVATALQSYSERGDDYTATLQMLIRVNNLEQFDNASLKKEEVAQLFN